MYAKYFKRFIDFVLAMSGLIVTSPLFLIIALCIKATSPGSIFFRQERIGLHKTHFSMLKFRTMRTDAPRDTPTHLLANPHAYITRIGRFLRKTSLDELPQLFNILKGDMAAVGPRPALWNQYDLIALRDQNGANAVRSGLTGWAQVHGRDELEIEEKARLDGVYAHNLSFGMDMRCIGKTCLAIFSRKGVVEGGTGTKRRHSA